MTWFVTQTLKLRIYGKISVSICSHSNLMRGTLPQADPGGRGSGGSNPPLKNNVKGFNPKYKTIS